MRLLSSVFTSSALVSSAHRYGIGRMSPSLAPRARQGARTMSNTANNDSNKGNNNDLFGDQFAQIYDHFAAQHHHPQGPWKIMAEKVHDFHTTRTTTEGLRILDLASGPGEPAATLAKQFPSATVLSTDFSEAMHLKARAVAKEIPNLEAHQADMQNLEAFDTDAFDVVSCSYGYMFPPDKDRAVAETFRVLKPGGILVATTWNRVPHFDLLAALAEQTFGVATPPAINPLSLAEPGLWEGMLAAAGFEDIRGQASVYPFHMGSDPDFQFLAIALPLMEQLQEQNAVDKARDIFAGLTKQHAEMDKDGNMIFVGNEFNCVVATKPL